MTVPPEKMECEQTLLVQADFDGELDAADAAALSLHVAGCAACRETAATLRRVHEGLKDAAVSAPAHLRRRVAGSNRSPATNMRRFNRWGFAGTGFGAGLAAAAAVALMMTAPAQDAALNDVIARDVIAGHVRSLQPGHLIDVVSTDRHTVKPWFDGRIDFAPPVKDLAARGFPLEGGRLDYADGRPVAALVYGRSTHTINMFIWPDEKAKDAAPAAAAHNGYNVVHFTQGGMQLWAVSDVEARELAEFAAQWRATP